jgi:alginate O-acetyltransferase complex protein AlgI
VYYFLLLVAEKYLLRDILHRLPPAVTRAGTLLAVLLGWMIFAFDGSVPALSPAALPAFLSALAGRNGPVLRSEWYELVRHLPLLALCALGATPLPKAVYRQTVYEKKQFWLRTALPVIALLLAVTDLSDVGFNPFLYFRF